MQLARFDELAESSRFPRHLLNTYKREIVFKNERKSKEMKEFIKWLEKDRATKLNEEVSLDEDIRVIHTRAGPIAAVLSKVDALQEAKNRSMDLIQIAESHKICLIADYQEYMIHQLDYMLRRVVGVAEDARKVIDIPLSVNSFSLEFSVKKIVKTLSQRSGVKVNITYTHVKDQLASTIHVLGETKTRFTDPMKMVQRTADEELKTIYEKMGHLEQTVRRMVLADCAVEEMPYLVHIDNPIRARFKSKPILFTLYTPRMKAATSKRKKKIKQKV